MSIEIIGAESLGVRGLCCLVTLPDRRIVIDPGVSLGYVRHGLLSVHGEFLITHRSAAGITCERHRKDATLPCNSLVGGLEKRQS